MALDLFGPTQGAGGVTVRPTETRSFTASDTFFRDCSSPDLDDGTEFQAAWFNEVTAVLRGLARGNGQTGGAVDIVTQDNADDSILLKTIQHLIQRGQPTYGEDTSVTANVITASISPAPAEYKKGMTVAIKANNSNTGQATLNLNGRGDVTVVRPDGTTLLDSDIATGSVNTYRFDGTYFQLLGANARPLLKRNTTIYVNAAIGNDANDGVSNTAGHALATLQGAVNLAFKYGPSQFTMTIILAPGTYNAGGRTPLYAGPNIVIDGQSAASVTLAPTNDFGVLIQGPNTGTAKNVTVNSTVSSLGPACFAANSGATLTTQNTASGASNGAIFNSSGGGTVNVGSHTFNGSCPAFWWASALGTIALLQGSTYTFAAAVTVSIGSAWASGCGNVSVSSVNPVTFLNAGNVTGPKYAAAANGVVNANAQGVNFFPGTVAGAGSLTTGGQYI